MSMRRCLICRRWNPHFERAFGAAAVRRLWFAQVLQSAMVADITGQYTDFGTVGAAALSITAARQGAKLSDDDRQAILGGMLTLPPHPDVPSALARLRTARLRLAALTNSAHKAAETQLTNAGLIDYFERVMSVDMVRRYKPAADVYRMAAGRLGVTTGQMRMVAAHNWDITGAMRAGCVGAFVARPGAVIGPLDETPDIIGRDLNEVADKILEIER